MNTKKLIAHVINERITDVRNLLRTGHSLAAALAEVRSKSCLGPDSWREVAEAFENSPPENELKARNRSARTTYKATWPCGCQRYYHELRKAKKAFENDGCPVCDSIADDQPKATGLSRVALTPDAFERAANGSGGYEADEVALATRYESGKVLWLSKASEISSK